MGMVLIHLRHSGSRGQRGDGRHRTDNLKDAAAAYRLAGFFNSIVLVLV
jgi:hypothetical protein